VIFQHPTWRFNEFQPQNMVSMAYSDFVLVAHSEWLKLRFKMLNLAGQTCPCGDVVSPGRPWWFWALSVERFGTKFEDSDSVSDEHELLFFKKEKCYQWYSPFSKQGLAVSRSLGILKIALGDDPLLLGDQPLLDLEWLVHVSWFGVVELHHWNRLIDLSTVAWNPYVNGNFRILKWRYCTI
jgi:hypothetical protein